MAPVDHGKLIQSLLHPAAETPAPRPANRRVRMVFNGTYVFDSARAVYVWEHPYYPQFYLPSDDLKLGAGVKFTPVKEVGDVNGMARVLLIEVTRAGEMEPKTFEALSLGEGKWAGTMNLSGLIRVNPADMDAIYEEDSRVFGHPKDPTKRIFLLPSSRPLTVKLGSHTLVDTTKPTPTSYIHLIEPMLPIRYYLPPTAVDPAILRPSTTQSFCPYKGNAEYYDVVLQEDGKEKVYKDLIWWYRYPMLECSAIAGMLCFYNEKVDIYLDGEKLG